MDMFLIDLPQPLPNSLNLTHGGSDPLLLLSPVRMQTAVSLLPREFANPHLGALAYNAPHNMGVSPPNVD